MNESDYIKGLEAQIEELQQKLSILQGNFKLMATVLMTDKFKPEKQIRLTAMVRIIEGEKMGGSQIEAVNMAVATKKKNHWDVSHNKLSTYQIKNVDDVRKVISIMLKNAGYPNMTYELVGDP